ncbi:MAG: hypothetical protein J6T12_05400 [Salinivirgaceae bacterium]|nr:hypothetical protein [Salinivirgaceae bacterium]
MPRPNNVVRDAINRIRTIQYVIPMNPDNHRDGIFAIETRCCPDSYRGKFSMTEDIIPMNPDSYCGLRC